MRAAIDGFCLYICKSKISVKLSGFQKSLLPAQNQACSNRRGTAMLAHEFLGVFLGRASVHSAQRRQSHGFIEERPPATLAASRSGILCGRYLRRNQWWGAGTRALRQRSGIWRICLLAAGYMCTSRDVRQYGAVIGGGKTEHVTFWNSSRDGGGVVADPERSRDGEGIVGKVAKREHVTDWGLGSSASENQNT
jgi:hypothetical protein